MVKECNNCKIDLKEGYRQCPNCLKLIQEDLPICPYCHVDLLEKEYPVIISRNKLLIICFMLSVLIVFFSGISYLSFIFYVELKFLL